MPLVAHPLGRAGLSLACLSAWLVLLFSGWVAGGAVHLLFVAAVALFPWRALSGSGGGSRPTDEMDEEDDDR